jgi:gliding motility-associated-like protein
MAVYFAERAKGEVGLIITGGVSPNNDGINEVFMIENIDQTNCFPSNSVEIYNRWGVLVFKTTQYDNVSRVFTGTSEGRATVNESKQLPTGTYYYIIKYKDINAIEKEQVGYLYLVM